MSRKAQVAVGMAVFVLLLATGGLLAGRQPVASRHADTRTVTDMTGRRVLVPDNPARVLSLCTSATDTIVRTGAPKRLAAIDEYSLIVPGAQGAVVIGKDSAISQEQILALRIDLAFIWWYQEDAAEMLEALSVPVVKISSGRAEQVPEMMRLVGQCMNCPQAVENLADAVARYLRQAPVARGIYGPRVYLELYGPFKTVGRDTYTNDLVELAGGQNVAAGASGSVLLSPEQLIQADPQVILFANEFTTAEAIARRNGMQAVSAVQAGRIRQVERRLLVAGAGLPEAVEELRRLLTLLPDQGR